MDQNDFQLAELYFKRAIQITEELRTPIPGEEFRTAFFSNRLSPITSWPNSVSALVMPEHLKR
jgi:hypothetical protein